MVPVGPRSLTVTALSTGEGCVVSSWLKFQVSPIPRKPWPHSRRKLGVLAVAAVSRPPCIEPKARKRRILRPGDRTHVDPPEPIEVSGQYRPRCAAPFEKETSGYWGFVRHCVGKSCPPLLGTWAHFANGSSRSRLCQTWLRNAGSSPVGGTFGGQETCDEFLKV